MPNSETLSDKLKHDRMMKRLWLKMARLYGPRWSEYGDVGGPQFQAWSEELEGFIPADVSGAIQMATEYNTPPTLAKFLSYCRKQKHVSRPSGEKSDTVRRIERETGRPFDYQEYRRMMTCDKTGVVLGDNWREMCESGVADCLRWRLER